MNSLSDAMSGILVSILASAEMKTLVGLILLDVILGIAAALKTGTFHWSAVAQFYRSNVIPYILGYTILHIAISFIIPPNALAGYGEGLSEALVFAAWGALVASLLRSVWGNLRLLYDGFTTPDSYEPLTRERL